MLTESMTRALAAIRASGGRAEPRVGGYWYGVDGRRLTHGALPGSKCAALGLPEPVSTTTVKALADAGLLVEDPVDRFKPPGQRAYLAAPAAETEC